MSTLLLATFLTLFWYTFVVTAKSVPIVSEMMLLYYLSYIFQPSIIINYSIITAVICDPVKMMISINIHIQALALIITHRLCIINGLIPFTNVSTFDPYLIEWISTVWIIIASLLIICAASTGLCNLNNMHNIQYDTFVTYFLLHCCKHCALQCMHYSSMKKFCTSFQDFLYHSYKLHHHKSSMCMKFQDGQISAVLLLFYTLQDMVVAHQHHSTHWQHYKQCDIVATTPYTLDYFDNYPKPQNIVEDIQAVWSLV